MGYRAFTIAELKSRFGVRFEEGRPLFADVPPLPASDFLKTTLAENIPLALAISTEKARSEMIIAPILLEVRRRAGVPLSFFSGTEFDVDSDQGLNGECDFLLSRSSEQLTVEAPVVAMIVNAKNDNIKSGLPECVAQLIAAQLFNRSRDRECVPIFGAVTTGSSWQFLRLNSDVVSIDGIEFYITEVDRILGVFVTMTRAADSPIGG